MGSLLFYPKFHALDSNGNILASGKLYTYIAGTSTAKATYSDRAATTPNANPVVMDSRGEATVYLTGLYKLVLKTSADVTVWTMDNVQGDTQGNYIFYPDSTESDQCTSGAGNSFYDILNTLGTSKKATIVFGHTGAANTTTYTCSTSYDASSYENITIEFENGALLSIATTKTLTLPSPSHVKSGLTQQIYSLTGTGKVAFDKGGTVIIESWGALGDNSNEDAPALQAALDSIPRGTVELLGGKTYKINDDIVWPLVSGTTLRTIVLKGQSESSSNNGAASSIPGNTAINYTGSGTFLDLRSGSDANNDFLGTIKNLNIYGPGTGGSTIGIDAYKVSRATFENIIIQFFDIGFELNYHAYYSVFHRTWFRNNGVGFEQKAGVINKTPFVECMFSHNDAEGFLRNNVQSSDSLVFSGCYIENNGSYGIKLTGYLYEVSFINNYFENNGDSDIYVSSSPFMNTTVSIINNKLGSDYYAVETVDIASLISIGNTYGGYDLVGGYVLKTSGKTAITSIGDNNRTIKPLANAVDGIYIGNPREPGWSSHWRLPLYRPRNHDGDVISDSSAKVPGDTTHYVVGVPGAGSSVTDLAGYTGTTTAASAVVAITAGTIANLVPGTYIKIATETFGTGDAYAQILKIDPTAVTITLDKTADNGVTTQAITYQYADIFHQGVSGLYTQKGTLSDDDAFESSNLFLKDYVNTGVAYVIVEGKTQYSGVVMFLVAAGGAETVLIGGGADFEVATGTLDGNDGSDTKVTLSAHTNGKLYVENRSGATQTISLKIVDGR